MKKYLLVILVLGFNIQCNEKNVDLGKGNNKNQQRICADSGGQIVLRENEDMECLCPEELIFNTELGCVDSSQIDKRICEETGGTYLGEIQCIKEPCLPCDCPQGTLFDSELGCGVVACTEEMKICFGDMEWDNTAGVCGSCQLNCENMTEEAEVECDENTEVKIHPDHLCKPICVAKDICIDGLEYVPDVTLCHSDYVMADASCVVVDGGICVGLTSPCGENADFFEGTCETFDLLGESECWNINDVQQGVCVTPSCSGENETFSEFSCEDTNKIPEDTSCRNLNSGGACWAGAMF